MDAIIWKKGTTTIGVIGVAMSKALMKIKDDNIFYLGMVVGAIVSLIGVASAIMYNGI